MVSFAPILLFAFVAIIGSHASGYPKKKECSYCEHNNECETEYCHRSKCVWRNKSSFNKCFIPLCGDCQKSEECTTELCYNYKCVPKRNPTLPACFPYRPKPTKTATATPTPTSTKTATPTPTSTTTATPTPTSTKTASPTPTSSVTPTPSSSVTPTPSKSPRVLKPDCDHCSYDNECASYKCTNGKCGTLYTVRSCPKGLCESCQKDSDCKSYICSYNKCVSSRHSRECRY